MNRLSIVLNCGLGDSILSRLLLENFKNKYEEIVVYHNKNILDIYRDKEYDYHNFLKEIGAMIFNEHPISYGGFKYFEGGDVHEFDLVLDNYNTQLASRPNSDHYCSGNPLDIGEYIVITTKIRMLDKDHFAALQSQFWPIINNCPYKIVILGERIVENNLEYSQLSNKVYSIYDFIKNNVIPEKIVDLTIPALGITSSNFLQMKQDFLIMKNSKMNVVFGEGGNLWMSLSVGNTLAYRQGSDDDPVGKTIRLLSHYQETFISKNWNDFIDRSKEWIRSAV